MTTGRSGCANKASMEADWAETGVSARFLVGRWDRASAEVGTESGPGCVMVAGRLCCRSGLWAAEMFSVMCGLMQTRGPVWCSHATAKKSLAKAGASGRSRSDKDRGMRPPGHRRAGR